MLLLTLFAACNDEKKEEGKKEEHSEGVVVSPGTAVVEGIEALEKADTDTTTFACTCEHKCKTQEECNKQCGSECSKK